MTGMGLGPVSIGRQWRRVWSCWQLYVLLLPALAYLLLFQYGPMYGVQIAFKQFRTSRGIWGSEWVGLKHFARFVQFPYFRRILLNTLTISLYSIATFPCAVVLALMIHEVDQARLKRAIQMISYAPHFISTVVLCSMLLLFLKRDTGVVNHLLAALGLDRVDFMIHPRYFASIYVWSGVWQSIGWGTIIYLAALSGVSPELVEAARIDGASRLKIVRHINLPTILPTVIIMLILRCGSVLSVGFEKVYLLQNPLNLDASQVISTYVYEVGLVGAQFSYSAAIGLFNNVVNILMLVLVNRIARKVCEVSIW